MEPTRDGEHERLLWVGVERERAALAAAHAAMDDLVARIVAYPWMWIWGDGSGGAIMQDLYERLDAAGFSRKPPPATKKTWAVPNKKRWDIYERDGFKCVVCGVQKNLSIDHITPRERGGSEQYENLQTLCKPCNTSKGAKTMDEWPH